jgi:hypothetical protein
MPSEAAVAEPTPRPAKPLFRQLEPIVPERHRGLKLDRAGRTYRFAAEQSAAPIVLPEFGRAGVCYPIVFTAGETPVPLVLLGNREHENLFVGPEGGWVAGFHVPWYIERYPFAVVDGPQPNTGIACLEADGAGLGPLIGDLLLENDAPTPMLNDILRFCNDYHRAAMATRSFGKMLADAGVLIDQTIAIPLGRERPPTRIAGFRIVDRDKFQALPDKTLLAWRKQGLLESVYQHLQSLNCRPFLSAAAMRRVNAPSS